MPRHKHDVNALYLSGEKSTGRRAKSCLNVFFHGISQYVRIIKPAAADDGDFYRHTWILNYKFEILIEC